MGDRTVCGICWGRYDETGRCECPEARRDPVAARHSFDGNGWLYIDNGHGSDWRERAAMHDDVEWLYDQDDTALLRRALEALEAALSDDQPYINQCKEAVAAIKERL